jgi:hypothetical protein
MAQNNKPETELLKTSDEYKTEKARFSIEEVLMTGTYNDEPWESEQLILTKQKLVTYGEQKGQDAMKASKTGQIFPDRQRIFIAKEDVKEVLKLFNTLKDVPAQPELKTV